MDPAPDVIISNDLHPFRLCARDKIVQDPVNRVFLINPDMAVGNKIVFDRPKFEKEPAGEIMDAESAKIGQPGVRADGCEFVGVNIDQNIATGVLVWDCFQDACIDGCGRVDVVPAVKAGEPAMRTAPGSHCSPILFPAFHDFPDWKPASLSIYEILPWKSTMANSMPVPAIDAKSPSY